MKPSTFNCFKFLLWRLGKAQVIDTSVTPMCCLFDFVYLFLQLAVEWQHMLDESFTQHLDTIKSCSAQQQRSVKVSGNPSAIVLL